jgi:hypothetical protein
MPKVNHKSAINCNNIVVATHFTKIVPAHLRFDILPDKISALAGDMDKAGNWAMKMSHPSIINTEIDIISFLCDRNCNEIGFIQPHLLSIEFFKP